jgi:hypothetical protein
VWYGALQTLVEIIMHPDPTYKSFCGIGARSTPPEILEQMKKIAEHLATCGWILRSGGADGADLAFEIGCDKVAGKKEIYLPWKGFNNSTSELYGVTDNACFIASTIHPVWNKLTYGAKKLHARNVYQVLGLDLDTPAKLVIAWTPNGKEVGGTTTAFKLAKQYKIRIINLAVEDFNFTQFS